MKNDYISRDFNYLENITFYIANCKLGFHPISLTNVFLLESKNISVFMINTSFTFLLGSKEEKFKYFIRFTGENIIFHFSNNYFNYGDAVN